MPISITKFRQNIYKLMDQVISTVVPIEINRNGKTVKIIVDDKPSKLMNLQKHKIINGDPKSISEIHWSDSFNEKYKKFN